MRGTVLSDLPKYVLETPPSGSVLSVEDVKDYLRLPQVVADHDSMIQSLIAAGVDQAEAFTRRKFLSQQWSVYWDGFPPTRRMEMMLVKFISLDKIEYLDQPNGEWVDLDPATFTLDDKSLVPAIVLESLVPMWPLTKYLSINSVHAKVTCGYGTADDIPQGVRMAIMRYVSTWYDNPAAVVQGRIATPLDITSERLLMPFKVFSF